jgi:hypothetical protein
VHKLTCLLLPAWAELGLLPASHSEDSSAQHSMAGSAVFNSAVLVCCAHHRLGASLELARCFCMRKHGGASRAVPPMHEVQPPCRLHAHLSGQSSPLAAVLAVALPLHEWKPVWTQPAGSAQARQAESPSAS